MDISAIFALAGHAKEAWAKRREHGGSFKEAARREAEITGMTQIKASGFSTASRYLKDSRAMAAKRGDYAMHFLYDIGHNILNRHAQAAAHDQHTFEMTKHVERGDHAKLTDKQLEHVVKNAHQFGGPNAETIKARAEQEQYDRLKAKSGAQHRMASERSAAAKAENDKARAVAQERKDAERAHKQAEKDARTAEKQKDKDAEKAAKAKEKQAKVAAETARQKQREYNNSPAGVKQQLLAKQEARVNLMQSKEYQELKKKELELKHSIKASVKEQAHNQKAYHTAGPGRPPGGPPVKAPGGMGRPGGSKGVKVQQHGGKPGAGAAKDDAWMQDYDARGINKNTGKLARGSVLGDLQDAGKVKAVGGIKRRPSIKSAARRARR